MPHQYSGIVQEPPQTIGQTGLFSGQGLLAYNLGQMHLPTEVQSRSATGSCSQCGLSVRLATIGKVGASSYDRVEGCLASFLPEIWFFGENIVSGSMPNLQFLLLMFIVMYS
jgi:hypothetical protein